MLVFKLGGSLLHQEDCVARLRNWLDKQQAGPVLGIVGGGEVIEGLRLLNRAHPFAQSDLHWICVDTLRTTWQVACKLFPEAIPVESSEALQSLCGQLRRQPDGVTNCVIPNAPASVVHPGLSDAGRRFHWVNPVSFYRSDLTEQPPMSQIDHTPLHFEWPKCGWETTSDSIAVVLARLLGAETCVLLKSCEIPDQLTLNEAGRLGMIDTDLQALVGKELRVRLERLP